MDSNITCKIQHLPKIHWQNLTKHEKEYLTECEVRTTNLYGLPNLLKPKVVIDAVKHIEIDYVESENSSDITFRRIVADPSYSTHRISNLIDFFLKLYIKHIRYYVRDDIDLRNYVPDKINENVIPQADEGAKGEIGY